MTRLSPALVVWVESGVGTPCGIGAPEAVAFPWGTGALVTSGSVVVIGGVVAQFELAGDGVDDVLVDVPLVVVGFAAAVLWEGAG